MVLSLGNKKNLLGLSPENRADGAQRISDVLPDNCRKVATHEPVHCHGATSISDLPTIQASSCVQCPSNVLKLPGITVCLPSDNVVHIHDRQCLSNQKTQPTPPWSLTDLPVLFLVEESSSRMLGYGIEMSVKFLPSLQQNFTHTYCSSSSFIVTLSPIWQTACARAQFSGCSSTTNALVKWDKWQVVVKTWC